MNEIAKFGGTSMAQIGAVLDIIEQNDPSVVVVSAPGKDTARVGCHTSELGAHKMTDMLLAGEIEQAEARAYEITERAGLETKDSARLVTSMHTWLQDYGEHAPARAASGERFSAELIAALTGRILLDPLSLVAIHCDHTPDVATTEDNLRAAIEPKKRYVLPGFYGYDSTSPSGQVQILERGGSDTSGALVSAALSQPYVNFTDVDGFYTTDPRVNVTARKITNLTYEEARALALGGSRLLHPEVARIMRASNLTTTVRSTFNADMPGTSITTQPQGPRAPIIGVASRPVLTLDIRRTGIDEQAGVMNSLYSSLADAGISYLLSNDGPDEAALFFDNAAVGDGHQLAELARHAVPDARVSVQECGLVVGVTSKTRAYGRTCVAATLAASAVDPNVIPSSSLSRQSIELVTHSSLVAKVEAAVHELVITT